MDINNVCTEPEDTRRVAVVIPCYKVTRHILNVIAMIQPDVWRIYVVDDCCPEQTGRLVEDSCNDLRIHVIYHRINKGVGGAVMTGYRAAIADGAEVIVKVDGDGQMDVGLIPFFISPILSGEADYTKGNRFFDLEHIRSMPMIRLFGNAALSFMSKLSTGYWDLFDPTNGFTAIHVEVAKRLPLNKISQRYFFETDLLFRLNTLQAVVIDIPMDAKYEDEVSNLKISRVIYEFFIKNIRNTWKRIFYNYYLRNFSVASLELPIGSLMLMFGIGFGSYTWYLSGQAGIPASGSRTVMLAAMPMLMGLQLILAFIGFDIASVPKRVFHKKITNNRNINKDK